MRVEQYLHENYPDTTVVVIVEDGCVLEVTKNDGEGTEVDSVVVDYDLLDTYCCPICDGDLTPDCECKSCGIEWE